MITTVLGMRGHGKSTWLKQQFFSYPRLILYDTLAEHLLADRAFNFQELFGFIKANHDKFYHLNYIPVNPEQEFEKFCNFVYELQNICMIVEEIDMFSSSAMVGKYLAYIIRYGRHRDIDLICTTRRPADVSRLITSQTEKFIIFRIIEPRDIVFIKMITGCDIDYSKLNKFEYFEIIQGQSEKKILSKP